MKEYESVRRIVPCHQMRGDVIGDFERFQGAPDFRVKHNGRMLNEAFIENKVTLRIAESKP